MITVIIRYSMQLLALIVMLSNSTQLLGNFLSQYSRHDPFPVYSTRYPHEFLYTYEVLKMKGLDSGKRGPEKFGLGLSVWGQNSDKAKDFNKNIIPPGALDGRWSMVGLLLGDTPQGKVLPASLQQAQAALFPGQQPPIDDPLAIDQNQLCGFIEPGTKYKNRGFRFDWAVQLYGDVGLLIEGGVSDICYTATVFSDLTCKANVLCGCPDDTSAQCEVCKKCDVKTNLTCKLKTIAHDIGLDICDFDKHFLEDFRGHLYWRHAYEVNYGRDGWPELLVMPFLVFSGSAATGTKVDPNVAFSLSSGNNDHNAVGFTAGIMFDFIDTISVGAEGGVTHFFKRDFCSYRIPNSLCQNGIYPFTTDVCISPGHNWHFNATLDAYHFLDRLSFFFQYTIVQHQEDSIKLKKCDPAFKPELLEKRSEWKVQLANIGLNYDISPYLSLGFLWQAPLQQQRTFRNTTVMFSFNASY